MRSLLLMIQFMTRYPIPVEIEFTAEHFVRGMKWLPLIGLLVGLPAAVAFQLGENLLGREPAAIFAVILLILLTGGLHLDGIADTADGLFSYRSRERMLEIMRDSTLGTNGVTAVVLSVLLKFIFLSAISGAYAPQAVMLAPVVGRMALTWHAAVARYAREQPGIGDYVNQSGPGQAAAATGISLVLSLAVLLLFGLAPGPALAAALLLHLAGILVGAGFAGYLKRRLGGITGDTLGATIELVEISTLFLFLVLSKYFLT